MSAGIRVGHLYSLMLFVAGSGLLLFAGHTFGVKKESARQRHAAYLRENERIGGVTRDIREILEYFHGTETKYPEGLAARLKAEWRIHESEEEPVRAVTTPFLQRLEVFCGRLDGGEDKPNVRSLTLVYNEDPYGAPLGIQINAETELVEVSMGHRKWQGTWEIRGYR